MKRVLTFGVYDLLHLGHIKLFEHAKMYGDELIVAVQSGDYIKKYKPLSETYYSTEDRLYMVSSIKYVDRVIMYEDVDAAICNIDFDVFVKGPDQIHQGFQNAELWCLNNGKQVVTLPRTEDISSTLLKSSVLK